jgi:hypothetical protein
MRKIFISAIVLLIPILLNAEESGFRGFPWGTDQQEILEAENEYNPHEGSVEGMTPYRIYYTELLENIDEDFLKCTNVIKRVEVRFYFLDTGLYKGEYILTSPIKDEHGFQVMYNRMDGCLQETFGSPSDSHQDLFGLFSHEWKQENRVIKFYGQANDSYSIHIEYIKRGILPYL